MRPAGLWLVLTGAGCLADPTPRVDGLCSAAPYPVATTNLERVTLEDSDVRASGWQLTFSDVGWLMPRSLLSPPAGDEVLSFEQPYRENGLGIAMYNKTSTETTAIDGMASTAAESATRVLVANGPARVAFEVTFSVPDPCGPSDTPVTGTSMFSIYPDAHIVRRDVLNLQAACSGFVVSSTNVFPASRFPRAYVYDADQANPATMDYDTRPMSRDFPDVRGKGAMCLGDDGPSLGMSWAVPALPEDLEQIELGLFRGDEPDAVHMNYIFGEEESTLAQRTYRSAVALFPVSGFACTTVRDLALATYQSPPELTDAPFDHGTGRYLAPLDTPLVATANVGTPMTGYIIGVLTDAPALKVTRRSAGGPGDVELVDGVDYLSQRDAGRDGTCFDFTLVFVDQLGAGDTLTITAR